MKWPGRREEVAAKGGTQGGRMGGWELEKQPGRVNRQERKQEGSGKKQVVLGQGKVPEGKLVAWERGRTRREGHKGW